MIVIEMVVDEMDDREVYKVEKVVTKEWTKANSSGTGFFEFRLQAWSFNQICISFHLLNNFCHG